MNHMHPKNKQNTDNNIDWIAVDSQATEDSNYNIIYDQSNEMNMDDIDIATGLRAYSNNNSIERNESSFDSIVMEPEATKDKENISDNTSEQHFARAIQEMEKKNTKRMYSNRKKKNRPEFADGYNKPGKKSARSGIFDAFFYIV